MPKLRSLFLRVLQLTTFFSAPIAGGILILIPEFTPLVLGSQWMPMVPVMQILVLAGLLRSLAATTGPVFRAVGQPKIETKWQAIRLFIIAMLIYHFTDHWGIMGTAMVVSINIFIATIGYSFAVLRITRCAFQDFIRCICPPLINTCIMIMILFYIKSRFFSVQYFELGILILVGFISYMLIALLFNTLLKYGIAKTIKEHLPIKDSS
jgi:O-antigen/teichoic acid export membrane protein